GAERALHGRLLVVLQPDALYQFELGFQPVDMLFLALEDIGEQLTRDVIADLLTMRDSLAQDRYGVVLERQIGLQNLAGVLTDPQAPEVLEVGQTLEKQNAFDELIRMLHL